MKNKIMAAQEAVNRIRDGVTIMVGGFMACGTPEILIDALVEKNARNLTIICNDAGVPGKMVPGMGGAMDLVVGAKKVIIAMQHTQKGARKILKECRLPYTAVGVVDMIITEMGVMEVTKEGIVLTELHPGYTVQQVREATEAELIIGPDLIEYYIIK